MPGRFDDITRSITVLREGKPPWRFPSRDDYVRFLISKGEVTSEDDFCNNPPIVQSVQFDWHSRAQHGCRFAQLISQNAKTHGWGTVVVSKLKTNTKALRELTSAIRRSIDDPAVLAVSILAPEITALSDLVQLLRLLRDELGWHVSSTTHVDDRGESRTLVAARIPLIASSSTKIVRSEVLSWVVGFGPFDAFPITRRSPCVELAFASKPKEFPLRSSRLNGDPSTAHIADVPVPIDDGAFERMWDNSIEGKRVLLGNTDPKLARARVTFALPGDLWAGT